MAYDMNDSTNNGGRCCKLREDFHSGLQTHKHRNSNELWNHWAERSSQGTFRRFLYHYPSKIGRVVLCSLLVMSFFFGVLPIAFQTAVASQSSAFSSHSKSYTRVKDHHPEIHHVEDRGMNNDASRDGEGAGFNGSVTRSSSPSDDDKVGQVEQLSVQAAMIEGRGNADKLVEESELNGRKSDNEDPMTRLVKNGVESSRKGREIELIFSQLSRVCFEELSCGECAAMLDPKSMGVVEKVFQHLHEKAMQALSHNEDGAEDRKSSKLSSRDSDEKILPNDSLKSMAIASSDAKSSFGEEESVAKKEEDKKRQHHSRSSGRKSSEVSQSWQTSGVLEGEDNRSKNPLPEGTWWYYLSPWRWFNSGHPSQKITEGMKRDTEDVTGSEKGMKDPSENKVRGNPKNDNSDSGMRHDQENRRIQENSTERLLIAQVSKGYQSPLPSSKGESMHNHRINALDDLCNNYKALLKKYHATSVVLSGPKVIDAEFSIGLFISNHGILRPTSLATEAQNEESAGGQAKNVVEADVDPVVLKLQETHEDGIEEIKNEVGSHDIGHLRSLAVHAEDEKDGHLQEPSKVSHTDGTVGGAIMSNEESEEISCIGIKQGKVKVNGGALDHNDDAVLVNLAQETQKDEGNIHEGDKGCNEKPQHSDASSSTGHQAHEKIEMVNSKGYPERSKAQSRKEKKQADFQKMMSERWMSWANKMCKYHMTPVSLEGVCNDKKKGRRLDKKSVFLGLPEQESASLQEESSSQLSTMAPVIQSDDALENMRGLNFFFVSRVALLIDVAAKFQAGGLRSTAPDVKQNSGVVPRISEAVAFFDVTPVVGDISEDDELLGYNYTGDDNGDITVDQHTTQAEEENSYDATMKEMQKEWDMVENEWNTLKYKGNKAKERARKSLGHLEEDLAKFFRGIKKAQKNLTRGSSGHQDSGDVDTAMGGSDLINNHRKPFYDALTYVVEMSLSQQMPNDAIKLPALSFRLPQGKIDFQRQKGHKKVNPISHSEDVQRSQRNFDYKNSDGAKLENIKEDDNNGGYDWHQWIPGFGSRRQTDKGNSEGGRVRDDSGRGRDKDDYATKYMPRDSSSASDSVDDSDTVSEGRSSGEDQSGGGVGQKFFPLPPISATSVPLISPGMVSTTQQSLKLSMHLHEGSYNNDQAANRHHKSHRNDDCMMCMSSVLVSSGGIGDGATEKDIIAGVAVLDLPSNRPINESETKESHTDDEMAIVRTFHGHHRQGWCQGYGDGICIRMRQKNSNDGTAKGSHSLNVVRHTEMNERKGKIESKKVPFLSISDPNDVLGSLSVASFESASVILPEEQSAKNGGDGWVSDWKRDPDEDHASHLHEYDVENPRERPSISKNEDGALSKEDAIREDPKPGVDGSHSRRSGSDIGLSQQKLKSQSRARYDLEKKRTDNAIDSESQEGDEKDMEKGDLSSSLTFWDWFYPKNDLESSEMDKHNDRTTSHHRATAATAIASFTIDKLTGKVLTLTIIPTQSSTLEKQSLFSVIESARATGDSSLPAGSYGEDIWHMNGPSLWALPWPLSPILLLISICLIGAFRKHQKAILRRNSVNETDPQTDPAPLPSPATSTSGCDITYYTAWSDTRVSQDGLGGIFNFWPLTWLLGYDTRLHSLRGSSAPYITNLQRSNSESNGLSWIGVRCPQKSILPSARPSVTQSAEVCHSSSKRGIGVYKENEPQDAQPRNINMKAGCHHVTSQNAEESETFDYSRMSEDTSLATEIVVVEGEERVHGQSKHQDARKLISKIRQLKGEDLTCNAGITFHGYHPPPFTPSSSTPQPDNCTAIQMCTSFASKGKGAKSYRRSRKLFNCREASSSERLVGSGQDYPCDASQEIRGIRYRAECGTGRIGHSICCGVEGQKKCVEDSREDSLNSYTSISANSCSPASISKTITSSDDDFERDKEDRPRDCDDTEYVSHLEEGPKPSFCLNEREGTEKRAVNKDEVSLFHSTISFNGDDGSYMYHGRLEEKKLKPFQCTRKWGYVEACMNKSDRVGLNRGLCSAIMNGRTKTLGDLKRGAAVVGCKGKKGCRRADEDESDDFESMTLGRKSAMREAMLDQFYKST